MGQFSVARMEIAGEDEGIHFRKRKRKGNEEKILQIQLGGIKFPQE